MREYVTKVDRLEEAENQRITEKKETEYKPVVMGRLSFHLLQLWLCCSYSRTLRCKGLLVFIFRWYSYTLI
jgi:hypothetical protein